MDSDDRFFLGVITVILGTIATVCICITYYNVTTTRIALEKGYSEVQNTSTSTHWEKK